MSTRIHILSENPRIRPWRSALLDIAKMTLEKVGQRLTLKDIDIVFSHDPDGAVAEIGGVGGYTPDAHRVLISLDPQNPLFKKNLLWSVSGTLAHELHHTVRWQKPGYGITLGEACITEGLADHFVLEVFPKYKPFPWTHALKGAALVRMQERAQKAWREPYDHSAWFFGSKQLRIPKWTGYTIGFTAVQEYLKRHQKMLPSTLVHKKAELFQIYALHPGTTLPDRLE